jgi:hypothetical protein
MECREIERIVWTDGPEAAPPSHIETCASCREESRRADDIRAALSGMRMRHAWPPAELEASILAAVTRSRLDRARGIVSHPKFWRGAAVGAAAAATAAVGLLVARRLAKPEPEPSLVA